VGLTAERLEFGHFLFRRHGGKVVLFGRFVALLRTLAAVLAGANGMAWGKFLIANAAGAVLWAGLYGYGAWWLGAEAKRLAGPVGIVTGVIGAVVIVAVVVVARRQEKRIMAAARQ
jgi:membrane protein DedA with SNARE-associated domain